MGILLFMIISTVYTVLYVFTKEPLYSDNYFSGLKDNLIKFIICFLIFLCLTIGFYGFAVITLIYYLLGGLDISLIPGGLPFVITVYLMGLFPLMELSGVIFLRKDIVWFSDE